MSEPKLTKDQKIKYLTEADKIAGQQNQALQKQFDHVCDLLNKVSKDDTNNQHKIVQLAKQVKTYEKIINPIEKAVKYDDKNMSTEKLAAILDDAIDDYLAKHDK